MKSAKSVIPSEASLRAESKEIVRRGGSGERKHPD